MALSQLTLSVNLLVILILLQSNFTRINVFNILSGPTTEPPTTTQPPPPLPRVPHTTGPCAASTMVISGCLQSWSAISLCGLFGNWW